MRLQTTSITALIAVVVACSSGDPPAREKEEAATAVEGGMCEEHGVLESLCTKCNPKLAAVFQAKGDWCEEHGFPESICPICHPERGGKPATDVAADKAPADGTKVRFQTKDAAAKAGIVTALAEAKPGGVHMTATATIAYDATRHAEVNARAAGVIRSIAVDVGAKVQKGDVIATLDSAALGADRSRLQAAASRVKVAETSYEREKGLLARGISAQKDVDIAQQELDAARADLAAARAALGMVGAGGAGAGGYSLRAPINGTVTRRRATVGHMVETDEVLFEIVDVSTMWAEIDVPEEQLGDVGPGQHVAVTVDAVREREWTGTIAYVAPEVDVRTRTARARVPLENPDGVLRANMYGQAEIALADARPMVIVPREAVQRAADVSLVFVQIAEDVFEARRVQLGVASGATVEILKGIAAGERVATRGSFLLKTETLKGAIGAGCCDVD